MIEITVKLENEVDSIYEVITITKGELLQIACNNAREKYFEGTWDNIYPVDDEVVIKANVV